MDGENILFEREAEAKQPTLMGLQRSIVSPMAIPGSISAVRTSPAHGEAAADIVPTDTARQVLNSWLRTRPNQETLVKKNVLTSLLY